MRTVIGAIVLAVGLSGCAAGEVPSSSGAPSSEAILATVNSCEPPGKSPWSASINVRAAVR